MVSRSDLMRGPVGCVVVRRNKEASATGCLSPFCHYKLSRPSTTAVMSKEEKVSASGLDNLTMDL